ncbi:MAG: hypothetical protein WCR67_04245 [Bacilli bacterium]
MNKKKALAFTSLLLVTAISTTSCIFDGFLDIFRSSASASTLDEDGNAIYKHVTGKTGYSSDYLNKDNIGLGVGYHYLPSIGDRKILVIPIEFSDDSFTNIEMQRLEYSFFGDSNQTGWESVASYYSKASYGKLSLTGEVSPIINLGMTKAVFKAKCAEDSYYTDAVMAQALKTLINNGEDYADYDTDGDNIIDAVWMVYSASYSNSSESSNPFWAFTTWATDNAIVNTTTNLKCNLYSWASIDFLLEKNYSITSYQQALDTTNADSHTFIHETGHMMGLDDYYSYDYGNKSSSGSTNYDTPVGGPDMMDFNVGGQNAYSKYFLGWIEPTVITTEYLSTNGNTLNLNALESESDDGNQAFILPIYDGEAEVFNGTPFDEYLIIQYYTPDGLNSSDSYEAYENGMKMYTKPGVLVYHVNSRIGKIVPGSKTNYWNGEVYDSLPNKSTDSSWGRSYLFYYLYSNTRSYCYDENMSDANSSFYRGRLVSLVSATGKKISGASTGFATNKCLYTDNMKFMADSGIYSNFVFDDGTKPAYGFKVNSCSDESCEITFSAL